MNPPDPFEAEIRQRDTDKGHSPAGITMTQSEWDRRYLLDLLDRERAQHDRCVATIGHSLDCPRPPLLEHGYTCGWCEWGRPDQPRSKVDYDRHVQETGHRGDKP